MGVSGLGSGCPGTGFWVSEDWDLGPETGIWNPGDWDLSPGTKIWAAGDCMEGFGEPWRPLERPGDAQKLGL